MTMTTSSDASPNPATQRSTAKAAPRRRRTVLASAQMEDLTPVLVGVYIRVSTAREEMISPELQQRDVDAYLLRMTATTRRPWRAVVVEQDLDKTGRSFARAGIQKLMAMMRTGEISTILTYRYDRFGRNLRQALNHLAEVEQLGGQVVSVSEPIDSTTAIGKYMVSQTLALADLQSRQIGEGWQRVHQYRVDRGLPTNGRERYGYLSHRSTHTRSDGAVRQCPQACGPGECQTGFVPDPETGPIVQRIYQSYIGGQGFQAIAKSLNNDGLQSPGTLAARRSGNAVRIERTATTTWCAGSVIDVADSGFAAGLITHNSKWFPGSHEPLIDQGQWQAYQHRRDSQRQVATKARSPKWSLAGIAKCGDCGGAMYCTSSPRGQQYALYCGAQRTSGTCVGSYRTRHSVEAAVELWLQTYAQELEAATLLALASAPMPVDPHVAERHKLTAILKLGNKKLERLLDAHIDGVLDLTTYKHRLAGLRADLTGAQQRLQSLEVEPSAPAVPTVLGFAATWPSLSVEARRDVASALLLEVCVHPNKTVELVPRWGQPVTMCFTNRGQLPTLGEG